MRLNPFKKTYTTKEIDLLDYFRQVEIFEGLTNSELSLFLPYFNERSYKKSEVVFFRGDPSRALYVIKSGVISLTVDYQNDLEELTKIEAVNSMGESCMLENTNRLLNAIVFSDTSEMYVLPQLNILEIFENNFQIKAKMFTALAKIYHQYNYNLFEAYRNSLGFFHLPQVYEKGTIAN